MNRSIAWVWVLLVASILWGSPAEAYRLWLETDYAGETLQAGQKITVDVHIDTEGDQGLRYFSVSVVSSS
mgnify:CR=1 FL=1